MTDQITRGDDGKMMMWAKRDWRCISNADCCPPEKGEPQNTCIAGFCAFVQLN